MYDFSSTEEAITFSLADFSIGSNTKDLVFEELNSFEPDPLVFLLACHNLCYLANNLILPSFIICGYPLQLVCRFGMRQ